MSCLKRNTADIFVGFVLLSVNACAQTAPSPINTDRPAFADSSVVVPAHALQFENGFLNTLSSGQQSFDLPETLLRFGLFDKTELRLTVPDYYYNLPASAWSDTVVGVKQQLGPLHGFDVSVVISLSFPTGSRGITSHGYDPSMQLPWSHSLSKNWTAAGMVSVYWPTEGNSRNTNGQMTLLFDRQLTKPWDGFVEYIGDFPERGGPEHILHFGTSYKLTLNQQVDFHLGFGLSSAPPAHFIGVGYSILARKVR